jgi:hypothetical protein
MANKFQLFTSRQFPCQTQKRFLKIQARLRADLKRRSDSLFSSSFSSFSRFLLFFCSPSVPFARALLFCDPPDCASNVLPPAAQRATPRCVLRGSHVVRETFVAVFTAIDWKCYQRRELSQCPHFHVAHTHSDCTPKSRDIFLGREPRCHHDGQ